MAPNALRTTYSEFAVGDILVTLADQREQLQLLQHNELLHKPWGHTLTNCNFYTLNEVVHNLEKLSVRNQNRRSTIGQKTHA